MMAIIRVHYNPLKSNPDIHHVGARTNLIEWLIENAPASLGEQGCVVKCNGEVIANSNEHNDMDKRCDIELNALDQVDVIALANGAEVLYAIVAAVVAVGISMALAPRPHIPNDAGQGKSSPNNQLNAASNEFRPYQAVPNVYGDMIITPDFIQPSFYVYENNRRVFTEVFCLSLGRGLVSEVKDGETLFDDLSHSTYELFRVGEGEVPTGLMRVVASEGSIDFPLPAPDVSLKRQDISGSFFEGPDTLVTNLTSEQMDDLGVAPGVSIRVSVQYTEIEPDVPLNYNQVREVVSVAGSRIDFATDVPASFPDSDRFSVNGTLFNESEYYTPGFFILQGDSMTAVRAHLAMPGGIRGETGDVVTVGYNLTLQEIDENGDDIGSPQIINGSFSGNTNEYLGKTEEFTGVSPGRYKIRALRRTNSLGTNSVDKLVLERVESVTPYTTTFPEATFIRTNRSSSPEQRRGASEKVNVRWQRELEIFNPETGNYGGYAHTTSFAQAVMDISRRAGIPLSRIGYDELFDIEGALADSRLGEFSFSFDDTDIDYKQQITTACNVALVNAYEVVGYWRFVRDERRAARSALFNRRNVAPNASKITDENFRTGDEDSVQVRYVNPANNTASYIHYRIDNSGNIVEGRGSDMYEIELAGCRNEYQARNRALREIGRIRYQRRRVAENVIMDALELGVGERVGWGYIADSEIFTGEVRAYSNGVFTTSERFTPVSGRNYYVYLTDDEGRTSDVVECFARSDGSEFGFEASGLEDDVYIADGVDSQMGSIYLISTEVDSHDYIMLKRGKPDEAGVTTVEMINYDERAYPDDSNNTLPV